MTVRQKTLRNVEADEASCASDKNAHRSTLVRVWIVSYYGRTRAPRGRLNPTSKIAVPLYMQYSACPREAPASPDWTNACARGTQTSNTALALTFPTASTLRYSTRHAPTGRTSTVVTRSHDLPFVRRSKCS